jgi:hypothetical protein
MAKAQAQGNALGLGFGRSEALLVLQVSHFSPPKTA